jgi:hypothetical protein
VRFNQSIALHGERDRRNDVKNSNNGCKGVKVRDPFSRKTGNMMDNIRAIQSFERRTKMITPTR